MHIDLNADLGEGCGDDAAILRYVSSANIACGWHAGDARTTGGMMESHLEEGRQDIGDGQALRHGVSVTDACISFAQTVPVLDGLAEGVRARPSKRG